MHNKWITYIFLGVMACALITLAFLQYNWLGSVSSEEQSRLSKSMTASTENFVTDLNQNFSQLNNNFEIQLSQNGEKPEQLLQDAYTNWIAKSNQPDLVKSVYYIKGVSDEKPLVKYFDPNTATLSQLNNPPVSIINWLQENSDAKKDFDNSLTISHGPDFGEPSFLMVPVKYLEMVTINDKNISQSIRVSLNVEQIDDGILIELNDDVIKETIIPEIARTYLTESFEDQYILSIIQSDGEDSLNVYFATKGLDVTKKPDFRRTIDKLDAQRFFIFNSGFGKNLDSFSKLDSISNKIKSIDVFKTSDSKSRISTSLSTSEFSANTIWTDSVLDHSAKVDTLITASFISSSDNPEWELWLSFKDGSLEAYVAKTKNRNLFISFGILAILGISVIMIVITAQRSHDLAQRQMLFVAGVSHELRTPITVIRSAAENLSAGVIHKEERRKEYADLMVKEGRRLSDMVDQIMEFSGIQSGKKVYQFSEFSISEFVEEVNNSCRPHLEEKGIILKYSIQTDLDICYADRDALFLAVTNLIHNAIKFSGTNSTVCLNANETIRSGKSKLIIQVQDMGDGIPEDELKQIFEPFFRGKKPIEEQIKGNGIGLSLVKKVIDAHNGEIAVNSSEGRGSTFTLKIPTDRHAS